MKKLLAILLLCAPAAYGQTYESAKAKWDAIYIGEDFTPAASTTVADEAGSNDGATVSVNTEDMDDTGPTGATWVPYSLYINATTGRVVNLTSTISNTDITIFFWAKRDVTNSRHVIVGTDADQDDYVRFESSDTTLRVRFGSGGTVNHTSLSGTDSWHSYAITYDSSEDVLKYYFDGSLVETVDPAGTLSPESIDQIGAMQDSTNVFDGHLAQICIANEILSDAEIAAFDAGPSSGSPLLLNLLLTSAVLTFSTAVLLRRRQCVTS